jgi:adenosylmethionine-8-amino-7-oxononanoate aminotransferase
MIDSRQSRVFPLELRRPMPVIVRGRGVWVEDAEGRRYLDAMSGGSMAATLGHGRRDLIAVARDQARRLSFVHNERLTNPWQEELAAALVALAPPGFTRVKFTVSGADANELAIQLARLYHVERGEPQRWQIISFAQAYHGPTMETLALTGRPGLQGPFTPYLPRHRHIPPATWRFDPSGRGSLDALDAVLAEVGPENVSAFFCEPISAAALPAHRPPDAFWEGLAERRARYGFLVCLDEIVTGMGRTGSWFAASQIPCPVDIIATAKGLGAGYAAIGAVLVRDEVFQALARGSREFSLGHTWDGAPLSCAVGLAVVRALRDEGWVDRVRERGPRLLEQLRAALAGIPIVREVRGHGYLLGVSFVDPRDGSSFLPPEWRVAARVDALAFERGLITLSTQPTRDGYAGDQTLFAPPFVSTDEELEEMVARFADAVRAAATEVEARLGSSPVRAHG